jgi:uncharacterized membrane protein HdeD (DUF308 family)
MARMKPPDSPALKYPQWFYLVRAVALLAVGVLILLNEAFDLGAGRPLIILTGLLLIGFAPADLVTFWKGRGPAG